MTRRSKQWSKHIAVSILLIFALTALSGSGGAVAQTWSADQQAAKQNGSNAANAALNVVGTPDGVRNNIANPMTGGSQLTTLDGKTSFSGQVSCPSTKQFMSVTILPSATGDLSMVLVQQDTTMSGAFNYAYNVPVLVSGVCGNGIISCNAGTWNNCSYYTWVADTTGAASLTQAPSIQQMAGCYCINNSCGTMLAMNDLNVILHDLGTGVSNAIQGNNPQYVITNTDVQNTTVSFYGQRSSNCQAALPGIQTPSTNLSQYYNNPSAMSNDAQGVVSTQTSDPNSYYSTLTSAANNSMGPTSTTQCIIRNDAVLTTQQVPTTNPISYTFYSTADNQFNLFLDGSSILSGSNWQTAFSTTLNINPGIHTVQIKGTYTSGAPGALFALTNNGDGSWPLVSDSSWSPVAVNAGVVGVAPWGVPNGWPGGTSAQWIWGSTPSTTTLTNSFTASLLVYQDTMNDSVITDNCTNDENNSKCQLKDETVDGVQTYRNYNPTGLAPLPSCQNFPGPTQVFNVCHNWWIKTRTYICTFGGSYDFSDIKKRAASINNSAIDGGAALTYTDMRKDASGNWVTEGDSIQLTPRDASACQQACKIKRPATDTQAAISGNATQYQASSRSYAVVYAQCKNGSPCPTQAGDIIDIDCQCIDNFAEAATILSVMNTAGKDLICSSGSFQ